MQSEPRLGLLLTDGTKLGARQPGHSPDMAPASTGTHSLTMAGGHSGELRLSQQWWVQPVPDVEDGYGWSGYAPTSGAAYTSGLALSFDGENDEGNGNVG